MRYVFAVLFVSLSAMSSVMGGTVGAREGWVVIDTTYPFSELTGRLETAVKDQRMGLVTSASASDGAKAAGFQIPGNKVYGVFRNDFARRMLAANVAAGIEAPIRFYVTENADGTATLSYKKPNRRVRALRTASKRAQRNRRRARRNLRENRRVRHAQEVAADGDGVPVERRQGNGVSVGTSRGR